MDYSNVEEKFGIDIAEQFLDFIAVNNGINTNMYKEILCNMGYGYGNYDAYDIADDKMKVLIKNNIIEMKEESLEYIRNHYRKYIELYIYENVEEYLNIISSKNFSYNEALYVLDKKEIDDNQKIKLLSLTAKPVSIIGKRYSSTIIDYILNNNFNEHDEKELYQNFSRYDKDIQSSIYKVAESRIDNIIADEYIVFDDELLSAILSNSRCNVADKIQLWAKAIPNLTEETCKKHFDEMGFPELKAIFTKRNNYTKAYENNSNITDILDELKKNTWIFDYYLNSDGDGYIVVKNTTKGRNH